MKKFASAAIAGAAAIALLAGGAGTLAYWNDTATVSAGQIVSGTLDITAGATTVTYLGTSAPVSRIVPGDTIVVTQDVTINAIGDGLKAKLELDRGALAPVLGYPGVNFTVRMLDGSGAVVTNPGSMTAVKASSIKQVVLTATFPASVRGQDAQGMTFPLSQLKLNLTQIA